MVKILGIALIGSMVVASAPAVSAEWVHSDWKWTCAGSGSTNQHRYWVTRGEDPLGARVMARKITMFLNVAGDRRTKVCENAAHCDWSAHEWTGGCVKTCSRADVVFVDGTVNSTQEQCAK
jgi:hypothetical protein